MPVADAAVILAAGAGSRLRPLTDLLPKPLMPVANRPIVERIVIALAAAERRDLYVNLHYRGEQVAAFLADGSRWGVRVSCAVEPRLTGPAGALHAFENLPESSALLVVSGDALHDVDLDGFARWHEASGRPLSVVLRHVPDPGRYGVAQLDDSGAITGFVEKPATGGAAVGLVSCGIYCLDTMLLARIPTGCVFDFGRHLIPELVAEGTPVGGYVTDAYWTDIGDVPSYIRGNLDAVLGLVHAGGLPGREVAPDVYAEEGCDISRHAHLSGPLVLGRHVVVGDDAELIGPAVVGPGACLAAGSHVMQSVIMAEAHIPEGTHVAGGVFGPAGVSVG